MRVLAAVVLGYFLVVGKAGPELGTGGPAPKLSEGMTSPAVAELDRVLGLAMADTPAAFDAALAVEPGNPTALFGRGVARRRSGESAGREDMNQARDFDGHIGEAFDEWGVETF